FQGGTEPPIGDMPEFYKRCGAPRGKTDILLLTDGECAIPPHEQDSFVKWKEESKARLTSMVIGYRADTYNGSLDKVSDEVHYVPALSVDSEGVQSVLSI